MNEERIFALMMDALDDEINERDSAELNAYLAEHPDLAQEWEAMQAVDTLFRVTPPLPAPAHFAEATLARLPNAGYRRAFMTIFYLLTFLIGLLPVVGITYLTSTVADVSIIELITQSTGELATIGRIFAGAIVTSLSSIFREQPQFLGWLFLGLGTVGMWLTVYRQMVNQTQPVAIAERVRN